MNLTFEQLIAPHPTTRGTAKNTFTAFQDVAGSAAVGLPVTLANELVVGSRVELEVFGEFSTTLTPTLQIGFIYGATAGTTGGTTLAASAATATASTVTSVPFHAKWLGIVTAVGTSGAIYGQGILDLGTSVSTFAAGTPIPVTAAARSVAIDTTAAKAWGVGAAWGTSSVSNSITVDVFTLKIPNQGRT